MAWGPHQTFLASHAAYCIADPDNDEHIDIDIDDDDSGICLPTTLFPLPRKTPLHVSAGPSVRIQDGSCVPSMPQFEGSNYEFLDEQTLTRLLQMRCSRSGRPEGSIDTGEPCDRCKRHDRPCRVPTPRPSGRKPGSLGRYRGVEKALRKIQAELHKAKTSSSHSPILPELLDLADGREEILDLFTTSQSCQTQKVPSNHGSEEAASTSSIPTMSPSLQGDCRPGVLQMSLSPSEPNSDSIPHESNGTVSNPLGLVADACGEAQALYQEPNAALSLLDRNTDSINLLNTSGQAEPAELARNLLGQTGYISIGRNLDKETLEYGLCTLLRDEVRTCRYKGYFRQPDMNEDRDTGPDLDPVDLGLVSMEEAYYLFSCFFERLHPINGILDPMLHTPEFVRSRSALLFTWILAISAQYDHRSGANSKRLRIHGEHLSKHVHASGAKSVEIAQGYYISLLSAAPANTLAEERSWLYTIHAFGVAAELGLDREAPTSGLSHNILGLKRPSQLAARHYQDLESTVAASGELGDQADDPTFGERLARNRERTWLRILLWERAHSAARGRVSAFPETELTRTIETWYLHPLADPNDKYTCAFILLRRHLGVLNDELKRQLKFPHTSRHWVRELFDLTLQPWCLTWLQPSDAPLTPSERISNTFLRYVYLHGRLWTLSFALHGHSGGTEDVDAIKEDCFEAAVNCCEIAVQDLQEIGEPLYCMLAPTWAMISYTAVLALRLFPLLYKGQVAREVELLALLAQVALQLERAGTTPSHRFGIAAILGQHLFMILRTRLDLVLSAAHAQAQPSQSQGSGPVHINYQGAHGLEPMNNNINHQPESSLQSFDPFSSAFDPFLTLPLLPGEENGSTEWFTGVLWDWAGQGFGSIA